MERELLAHVAYVEAHLYLADGATIRTVAKLMGRSKSTIAYDLRTRLAGVDDGLYQRVQEKLDKNIENAPYMATIARHSK